MSDTGQISFLSEILRKATHTGALIIPVGYYFLDISKPQMLILMGVALILVLSADISRLRNWSFWTEFAQKYLSSMVRKHESKGDFTGATYILISIILTVALFPKPIAVTALIYIMVGDTWAALIGRRYGKHKIINNKTIEGSAAFLISTLIVAIFAPGLTLFVAVFGSVVATVTEAMPLKIDDNLTVPLISGLSMMLCQKILMSL